jgi:hypothetical protein
MFSPGNALQPQSNSPFHETAKAGEEVKLHLDFNDPLKTLLSVFGTLEPVQDRLSRMYVKS